MWFGEEKGNKIYFRTAKLYSELSVTTDYKNSEASERLLKRLIFPVIAYYKTLQYYGYQEKIALNFTRCEVEKAAAGCARVLSDQMRKILPFHAFKRNAHRFLGSKFPAAVFQRSALSLRGGRISFRIDSCFYNLIAQKFGCGELCELFCEYERISFAGLAPKIVCSRTATLCEGCDFCDFAFTKGKEAECRQVSGKL